MRKSKTGGRKASPKSKRQITPHKGGRTGQLHGRFTPEEKSEIERAMGKLSFSDWCKSNSRNVVVIGYDGPDDNTYNYQYKGMFVAGFDTAEDALKAALVEMQAAA